MIGAKTARRHLPTFAVLALAWLLLIDIPTRVPLGVISLSGAATIASAALALLLGWLAFTTRLALRSQPKLQPTFAARSSLHPGLPVTMLTFLIFAIVRLLMNVTPEGVQNLSVYIIFGGAIASCAAFSLPGAAARFLGALRVVGVTISAVEIVSFALGIEIYGERAFALAALVVLAAIIPLPASRTWHHFVPFLILAAIAVSLSRTALAIGLAILPMIVLGDKYKAKTFRWVVAAGTAALIAFFLVTEYPPIRNRFLVGDSAFNLGGLPINTSGRFMIWDLTLRSWESGSTIFGQGPGSSVAFLSSLYSEISHPHSDYLRILHDFGLVGLALFIFGYWALLWSAIRRSRRSKDVVVRPIHHASTLVLLVVAAAALTDNVLVYPFVMLPAGVVVGLSMGSVPLVPAPPIPGENPLRSI